MDNVDKMKKDMNKFNSYLKELKNETSIDDYYEEAPTVNNINESINRNTYKKSNTSAFKKMMTEDYDYTESKFKKTNTAYFISMKTEYPINLLEDVFNILNKYDEIARVSLMDRRIILTVNTKEEISQADIIVLQNIGFIKKDTMI